MKTTLKTLIAAAALALVAGCTDPAKVPAETAVKAADSAVSSLGAEVTKYAPEQTKAVQDALAAAKEKIAAKDFKGALALAGDIPSKVKNVVAAAADKKDELMKAFQDATGGLPELLEAVKAKIAALGLEKKLPAGLDAGKLDAAKQGLAEVQAGWEKASGELKAGSLQAAIDAAKGLKAKGLEILTSIGGEPPAAAAAPGAAPAGAPAPAAAPPAAAPAPAAQ
jgi:hypothetical protein